MTNRDLERREDEVIRQGRELGERLAAIQQPRSNYAIRHFVVGQHDTPAKQWAQAVLELQIRVFTIERARLDVEEKAVALRKAEAKGRAAEDNDERDLAGIAADRIRIDLREIELARLGIVREAAVLMGVVHEIEAATNDGRPFTREQLEADEAVYWPLRLKRQAYEHARGAIDPGNAEALLQMLTEPGEFREAIISDDTLWLMLGAGPDRSLEGRVERLREVRDEASRLIEDAKRQIDAQAKAAIEAPKGE